MADSEMKRHEWWRLQYRKARDLDHLSPEGLSERVNDCINNGRTRTKRGKLGILPADQPLGEAWMILFTQILEECELRGYAYPGPINISSYRSALEHAFDPIPDMDSVVKERNLDSKPYLLKFGDPHWLRQSLEVGKFRVAPASFYSSESHNHARRDSELHRIVNLNPRDPRRSTLVSPANPETTNTLTAISCSTDYYLFSLSAAYSARLFGDFASTACLVVFNPKRFIDRLMHALVGRLPGWFIELTPVTYYDPVRVDPRTIVVPAFKPFKHAYQAEVRAVCLPPQLTVDLQPIEIELGPLHDCAVLVDLSTHPPVALEPDPLDTPVRLFGTTQPESSMLKHLPDVAKMQGIALHRAEPRHEDWYFEIQYTDSSDVWHVLKVPMLDGLYLSNLLQAAEKEQHLSIWNRK